ncbi:phospholipase D-like domain-containing protein [Erwinia sp. S59]|uniref:phospholipase D-like domain-containing protein n=1 Tax=Erwinia sp. S59 TaxID=2769340 RepID=UPI00190DAB5D|nr:phospholipase D-like domain-containing protein [Erwinia sp. S59]MBK0090090.1 phospholipase [Erwinia sp. S59]
MKQDSFVVPIAPQEVDHGVITSPWFVQNTEYPPALATYKPLVNGEEAFAAVHHAIANAKKSVDIICWGFQPSMYFIRDGRAPSIGELLVDVAKKNNVEVRVLGWEMPLNTAGGAGEANLPGKGIVRIKDRAGQSATDEQYAKDRKWFADHALFNTIKEISVGIGTTPKKLEQFPQFVSRGFNVDERAEIRYQAALHALDKDISKMTVALLTATATHHQKTVLVDYELAEHAVGFVMGHNMLDEYWDTDDHSSRRRAGSADAYAPNMGASGFLPRQDISSQVTGPILEHLHENFAKAWFKETHQDLLALRNAKKVAKELKPRPEFGTPIMAQLLRTQAQENKRDIETLYLQAVNNATQFIYIENQYFRWPPLAELINKIAKEQTGKGRELNKHGALHLFVVTNATDEGIGSGTVNTQRMLKVLGRADTIPGITKQMQIDKLQKEAGTTPVSAIYTPKYAEDFLKKQRELDVKILEIEKSTIIPESRPGLNIHVCSLVAMDSPPDNWVPVYIHSKLMIVNDVFTTHGSANINTRSMQVDSEMNIAHEWASVTQSLRRRLWNLHTNGMGSVDDSKSAFDIWKRIISDNDRMMSEKNKPVAPLIGFLYSKSKLKDMD